MTVTTLIHTGLLIAVLELTVPFALAQPAPQDPFYASLSFGDTEAAVRHTMNTEPAEVKRRNLAGVEYTSMVFNIKGSRYTITFFGGRLVAKVVEAKAAAWSLF